MAPENINELYKKHPLRQETILARVRKQRKSLEGISEDRIAEARVTHLVNLDDFVEFKQADLMTCEVPSGQFDVIWGQSSWTHIQHKEEFLERWAGAMKSGGMNAFEDLFLPRNAEIGN